MPKIKKWEPDEFYQPSGDNKKAYFKKYGHAFGKSKAFKVKNGNLVVYDYELNDYVPVERAMAFPKYIITNDKNLDAIKDNFLPPGASKSECSHTKDGHWCGRCKITNKGENMKKHPFIRRQSTSEAFDVQESYQTPILMATISQIRAEQQRMDRQAKINEINEVLDTPEKRRAAALALADREVRADKAIQGGHYQQRHDNRDSVHYGEPQVHNKEDTAERNKRADVGQDGRVHADLVYSGLYLKDKDGNLKNVSDMIKKNKADAPSHHRKDFRDATGKLISVDDHDRTTLTSRIRNTDLALKVPSNLEPEEGESANEFDLRLKKYMKTPEGEKHTREKGWATGRYRKSIRDKLASHHKSDTTHFLKNPGAKDKVDADYQKEKNRSYFDDVSDKADALDYSSPLMRVRREKDHEESNLKKYHKNYDPNKENSEPKSEPQKRSLGKAQHASSDKYRDTGVSTRDTEATKQKTDVDSEKEAKEKQRYDVLQAAKQKHEPQEKPKVQGPDYSVYNTELEKLKDEMDFDSPEFKKAWSALKIKHGIREGYVQDSTWKPNKDLNPDVHSSNIKSLLKELKAHLTKDIKKESDVMGKTFPSKFRGICYKPPTLNDDKNENSFNSLQNGDTKINDMLISVQKDPNKDRKRPFIRSRPLSATN